MARRSRPPRTLSVAVIGLGRFGRALALELVEHGHEVLGIDSDEETVQDLHGSLTHVVRADSTSEQALVQLDIDSFDRVVIGIGTDLQASILTASILRRRDRCEIWAKAVSSQHGQILDQLGVHHVVYPESDMGRRVAHLVQGAVKDFVALDDDLVVAVTEAPAAICRVPLADSRPGPRFHVTVAAVKRDGRWSPAGPDTVLAEGETVAVFGSAHHTERFAAAR